MISVRAVRGKASPAVPCCCPDGDRLIHALLTAENPPRDSPGVLLTAGLLPAPPRKNPAIKLQRGAFAVLSVEDSVMLWEEVSKGGE